MTTSDRAHPNFSYYSALVLFVAGMGGLLYGIDVGIISAALLYLGKTISLTLAQTSIIVAAVLGGSMLSSLIAGLLADHFGRKPMVRISALLFVVSVLLIVSSQGFVNLFLGRLLQGFSGGVIAVVMPLYLAESLESKHRGKGAGVFQLMLTFGIVLAAVSGLYYTRQAEAVIAAATAAGNASLVHAAQEHAWRSMFLSIIYPGLVFLAGSFFISESPRWLFRRGRVDAARQVLRRASSSEDAERQLSDMQALATTDAASKSSAAGSIFHRRYVVPFSLACVILVCNQTTGINSLLAYLSVILRHAGMNAQHATQGDLAVKLLNCIMTAVAISLVDRRGRKFLLMVGTGIIVVALSGAALLFHGFESRQIDVGRQLQAKVHGDRLVLNDCNSLVVPQIAAAQRTLSVLYSDGGGSKIAPAACSGPVPVLDIKTEGAQQLRVQHGFYGPAPGSTTSWLIAACIGLFMAAFAVGPGIVVWLALSELMPTRIRSAGMGIALLLNQGASTLIAGLFLPVAGNHGYSLIFAIWTLCSVVYFIVAVYFLPETKGKTLEEIETSFTSRSDNQSLLSC